MKKSDVTYILCAAFAALANFFYCCTIWFGIKVPRYYPQEHTWKWVNEQGVPSQAWYGMQAFAYLAAGVVTLAIFLFLKRFASAETSLKPVHTRILALAAILTMIICLGYTMHHEFAKWGVFTVVGL